MNILFASSEAVPFAVSGGLAEVAGALPKALKAKGEDVRVILPLYGSVTEEQRAEMKYLLNFDVAVAWRRQYCGVFEAKADGVTYYLLDNEYYFKRSGLYGYYDDAERFAFFSRAVLDTVKHLEELDGFKPDIIHCNDWQTALTPVFYKTMYCQDPWYQGIKTVFTIHNIQYQGTYGMDIIGDVVGLKPEDAGILEYDGDANFMKGGIECADWVTTVSPSYAQEILDPWYSHGLDPILRERQWKLSGILNGIATDTNDPETDPNLALHFNVSNAKEGKAANKAALQETMGLPQKPDVPLIGIVTRLVSHKGLDLIKGVFDEFLATTEVQVVVLGSGDWQYENYFRELADRYGDKLAVRIGFVPSLAKKIYGGADLFLMPSKSEPCGLAQMIALRYGTIPIVRETGGLRDSITDSGDGQGNGYTFKTYNAHDMLGALRRAVDTYYNAKDYWDTLVIRALECDFSWNKSANEYIKLYKQLVKE